MFNQKDNGSYQYEDLEEQKEQEIYIFVNEFKWIMLLFFVVDLPQYYSDQQDLSAH